MFLPSSECHALCHPKCSPCLPSTCGMSSDCSLHLSEGVCRDKISSPGQQQLKEASGHMHLEGWMKQPRLERKRIHSQRNVFHILLISNFLHCNLLYSSTLALD